MELSSLLKFENITFAFFLMFILSVKNLFKARYCFLKAAFGTGHTVFHR